MADVERLNYENTVAAFTGLMLKKLRENDHKTHWANEATLDLFKYLKDEVVELSEELGRLALKHAGASPVKVARECADVANLALMVADKVGGLDSDLPEREAVTIDILQREVVDLRRRVAHENARWKEVFRQHLEERTQRLNLEAILKSRAG